MKAKPDNISQEDWDDGEIPELTDEDFARMRPAIEVHPDIVEAYNTGNLKLRQGERGAQKAPTKQPVSIRLSPEVTEYFRATGSGWQTRLDKVLKDYVAAQR
ncbi:MAG TPA: hypothetical protein DD827_03865 [Gammaproteobacteria bacterium]|jgi:uncharacterized protein (DUF4415 family)|nr:hypothetical protein [Gammaproteobacteria bacterium]